MDDQNQKRLEELEKAIIGLKVRDQGEPDEMDWQGFKIYASERGSVTRVGIWLISQIRSLQGELEKTRTANVAANKLYAEISDDLAKEREEKERLRVLRYTVHDLNDAFRDGEQPCTDFTPQHENNGYGEWDNGHSCPGCCGLRSFCTGCSLDHHTTGWENCAGRAKATLHAANERVEKLEHGLVRLCAPGTCKVIPPNECTCIVVVAEMRASVEKMKKKKHGL